MYTRGFLEYTVQSAIKARRLSHQGGDPTTAPEAVGSTSDLQVVEKSIAQEPPETASGVFQDSAGTQS